MTKVEGVSSGKKDRILILDDEPSILEILGQHFLDEPYECTLIGSPRAALQELSRNSYDLLMTDLKMPEMHGLQVVQEARKIDPDMAVLVVTAMLDVQSAVDTLRAGADDYLLKPFNLAEISVSVERALDRRRLVIENRNYQTELESRVKEATRGLEEANRELQQTKEYLESLLRSSVDAIITIEPGGTISFVNPGTCVLLDTEADSLLHAPLDNYFAAGPQEGKFVRRKLRDHPSLQNYETELSRRDGTHVPVNMSLSTVYDDEGKAVSYLVVCKDITEQKRLEEELKEMSIKDGLTGLYNQRHFHDRLESEIERARRQGHQLSLLLFDVDGFKTYNDCHGHLEGDKVLATVGQVMLECTREHVDIGFRYGGDEFTAILPEADEEQAYVIAERIRKIFQDKHFDDLTLSIGLMSYKDGGNARSFLRMTDAMMYDAKRSGGNRVYIYRQDGSSDEPKAEKDETS